MGIVQGGGIDSDLNELGVKQAAAFLNTTSIYLLIKSILPALKRSIQSVSQFIEKNIPWEKHAGLNEINWGHREGTRITPEEDAYYFSVIEAWSKGDIELRIEGGESPMDVVRRQKPVLDLILSRPEETHILICMHGRAMRMFLSLMLHYPLQCMDIFEHQNLCLYKLHYSGNMFTVESYNDVSHLRNIM
jgi:probable phosphoglycerate mutase